MKRTLLLFLSASHLHAQLMAGREIEQQHEFPDTSEGRLGFRSFLQDMHYPAYLLTDLIEEDFRHEVVPHLIGKNRTALLQRKFDQFYRNTPFHKATLLQRQTSGRRDDEMLFSALTNPSLITPWLNIMLEQQIPLAGIYSVPQISAPLIRNSPSSHLLLISWERFSGLRQTYFSEHRLQISRLTTLHANLTFHEAVINELGPTYQYLKSLSLLPPGQALDVRILCHNSDLNLLRSQLPSGPDMNYDFADIEEIGKQLGIDYRFTDSDASQIFLHQLCNHSPTTHYASSIHTHYYALWKMRRILNWSSGLVLLASLAWAATTIWLNGSRISEAQAMKTQIQRSWQEAQLITKNFPPSAIPPEDMKTSVMLSHQLDRHQSDQLALLRPISSALDHFPQIELHDLSWQENPSESAASGPVQIITIKGDLHDFGNDYRAALAYLDRFQFELSRSGYQTALLAKPLDISPGGSLADQREEREDALGFSLQLVWRPS